MNYISNFGSWLYWNVASFFGHYKKGTIVTIGLDNAGKTTLLYRLATGKVGSFAPTGRASEKGDGEGGELN